MFIQSKSSTDYNLKNGLAIKSRLGGKEILVQWSNGRQQWCQAEDIQGAIRFVELESTSSIDYFGEDD